MFATIIIIIVSLQKTQKRFCV